MERLDWIEGEGVEALRGQRAALLLLPGLLDARGIGLEAGAGQAPGDVGLQAGAQVGQALAQLAALAGRQAQGARAVGLVEVVQVAQVRRHGPLREVANQLPTKGRS